jgi:hypothetical protein
LLSLCATFPHNTVHYFSFKLDEREIEQLALTARFAMNATHCLSSNQDSADRLLQFAPIHAHLKFLPKRINKTALAVTF